MNIKKCQVTNKLGVHARAAAKFVQTANRYAAHIEVRFGEKTANGKSIMGMMMLAASQGSWLEISAEGEEADGAMDAITQLLNNKFGEEN